MRRDLSKLAEKEFDLVIIGAGMFGVCAAWEAVLQGMSVAIIEKGDFCQATSANHYKMVHGGIRYIQHGDVKRIEESSRERSAFLRIAPHLVTPLPIVIPTYGHGIKGKEALRIGSAAYDILTINRNAGIEDKKRHIPFTKFISKKDVLDLFPGINKDGLTGAGIFSDAQMYNSPRLALSFLKSAVENGAEAANYLEVVNLLKKGNKVYGAKVKDTIDDNEFEIRSKIVLNTAGPWANELLEKTLKLTIDPKPAFSRDAAFIVRKKPRNKYSLATLLKTKDVDTLFDRGGRHLFIVPWLDRDITMVGVWHVVWSGKKDHVFVTEEELREFVDEVNVAYPDIDLAYEDISMVNTGLTLFGETTPGSKRMSFGKRSLLIDHSQSHSIDGLITLIGVRATIARGMAEKAIKLVGDKLSKPVSKSKTEYTPIYGGEIGIFEDYVKNVSQKNQYEIDDKVLRALIHNYGSSYKEVTKYIDKDNNLSRPINNSTVLSAEIVHAVKDEMATNLSDIVLRRTDLGTAGDPGKTALEQVANLMAKNLSWDEQKTNEEINYMMRYFSQKGAVKDYSHSEEIEAKL